MRCHFHSSSQGACLRVCSAERLPRLCASKCFLTSGTAPHLVMKVSHTSSRSYTDPRCALQTQAHAPVQISTHTLRSCEVQRCAQAASAVLLLCSLFSCTPCAFSLSHSVPFGLPLCSRRFSPLSPAPILPSYLLSSRSLPHHLLLSVSFKVRTDSVFCRCSVFKAS